MATLHCGGTNPMMFFSYDGILWYSFLIYLTLLRKCQAAADSPPNHYLNSTQLSTIISTGTSVIFNTCTTTLTLPPLTTTVGNVTVRSTTTITTVVTLPPDAPARRIVRATSLSPTSMDLPHPSDIILTTWTTITTCGVTVTLVITLPAVTQKMTVDQLITETQTVFARVPSSSKSTTSSTQEVVPPAQQVTTSSTARAIPPVAEVTTTSSETTPSAGIIQATTINNVPFTLSTITSITAIVVNDVTLLPGQALTTDAIEFSNGQTGLDINMVASVGAIVASIFGINSKFSNVHHPSNTWLTSTTQHLQTM
ncbi:hypothetical protein BKA64DRAFT_393114 [Cadophora sp. MPI-SDFR-AT-0126]|nr:hypothetical protein BKA64DRAFT_393114 [Leotiomycetes sp. MPI-SDFR-AT-0126]